MAKTIPDLWPQEEFGALGELPPVTILREQATHLGERTHNLVEAQVRTTAPSADHFLHHFELVAPALDNYTYPLFSVAHDIRLYPLTVDFHPSSSLSEGFKAQTQEEFLDRLRTIFASPETKRIIQALISQSTS
jgi:hypothetical protein